MAFENIDCVKPVAAGLAKLPEGGVTVTARKLGNRSGKMTRYIRVSIGAKLALAISLTLPEQRLRLLFGTEQDAGKIMVSPDNEAGKFLAKRNKVGAYVMSINAPTADGMFSLEFPTFAVARIEALRPQNGKPPHFVFQASAAMLALED